MEYLICTARNLSLIAQNTQNTAITEDCELLIEPQIEMILTTYEKQMELIDGNLINIKKIKGHRIGLSINAAQALVTQLQEWITEAEQLEQRLEQCKLKTDSKT